MGNLLLGIDVVFSFQNILVIVIGTLIGMLVGALPGLGPSIGVALLLPFTYNLSPVASLLLLVALYQAAEYGGSISSILLSTPGTPAAVATLLDGYPMTKQGYPGKALGYSLTASTIGGFFGVIVLMTLSIPLAKLALKFGPPEYFALGVLGLTAVASLSSNYLSKSLLSALFGLFIATIGIDVITGYSRFSFGMPELYEGLNLLPILIGLFAVSEVLKLIGEDLNTQLKIKAKNFKVGISFNELKVVKKAIGIGSIIGSFVGVFPGMGAGPASWFAYNEAKRVSKNPEKFGNGSPEGIAAPESANNAAVGGALVPLLTLGIPGSPTTAIMLGALIIQGIQPGPQIFDKNPDLVYGLFVGLLVATALMWFLGQITTNIWARAVAIPNRILAPIILLISMIGAYVARNLVFDIGIMLVFGVLGYLLKKFNYSLPSVVLGFILGGMIESNLRRSLLLFDGNYSGFFSRPVALFILLLAFLSIISFIHRLNKEKKKGQKEEF
ncbi:tripartite tricarboxylate transporter permease [Tepidibacillus infernus]|uniref:DUF112 domain-containing protein n=1 Tax=Tepidibacillus decaturensis TaxID=1413211 RepID=A0A135L6D4_9BACI|nr:tripartite tricarboxylate transporter permease [Tepidibacillus decaturensis]KXG44584.1 hypothetical protein U473_11570 [Tepidibacillus decaturensis]